MRLITKKEAENPNYQINPNDVNSSSASDFNSDDEKDMDNE